MLAYECTEAQLHDVAPAIDWIWYGLVAPGKISLLTSPGKTGKTTLLSILLAHRHSGAALLDQAVRPGMSAIVSEEPREDWGRRRNRWSFGPETRYFCQPFLAGADAAERDALIDRLVQIKETEPLDLVAIDPLVDFLPAGAENLACKLVASLAPLRRLTSLGVAVLLLHHPRRAAAPIGLAARGTGALAAFVDVVLELHAFNPANLDDRRRRLFALSRFRETPRSLFMELSADGLAYALAAEPAPATDLDHGTAKALRLLLDDASHELTRQEILGRWPEDFPRPHAAHLWRCLEGALAAGEIERDGVGTRNKPYRYWLKGKKEKWQDDPDYALWQLINPPRPEFPWEKK